MATFFVGRDQYHGHSYDIFEIEPEWMPLAGACGKQTHMWRSNGRLINVSDKDAEWLFAGIDLKPGEDVEIEIREIGTR